jgi:hypothetical protein
LGFVAIASPDSICENDSRRRYDRSHLSQQLSSESFGFDGQPTPLIVGDPQASFAQLFAQNTILLAQVFDHLKLTMIHPSGHSDQYEPEWIEDNRHLRIATLSTAANPRACNVY